MESVKYPLRDQDIPEAWYNIVADFAQPLPPMLHPGTGQPVTPDDLAPIFAPGLIEQELSTERWIGIPGEVREIYRQWRPSPLFRARRLEAALDTPARIYYKYEGVSPAGSHKPNSAIPQAWYNRQAGIRRLVTETGAGQWGSSLAMACAFFGMECQVFMVRVSFDQKPYRKALMETFGARCTASPSMETDCGRAILEKDPNCRGSLGMAISEAVECAIKSNGQARYALGSVLNHVCLHQTVIGLEALRQFEQAQDYPDVIVGCTGGGSNFAGTAFPFIGENVRHGKKTRIVAVEPAACPSLTKGRLAYDFGDTSRLTPLLRMHTLGSAFMPPAFHTGGLRYHGMAPTVSHALHLGLIEARGIQQMDALGSGLLFARSEGIVPAPEASHAIAGAIHEARLCKEQGQSRAILFNLCGHGHFDMQAYTDYLAGKLRDYEYPQEEIAMALSGLPVVPVQAG